VTADRGVITLSHGSGGKATHKLVESVFLPAFSNEALSRLGDAAVLDVGGERLAFTTDSFVVSPLFFEGGTGRSTTWQPVAPNRSRCRRVS